jgi:hypothetical protein
LRINNQGLTENVSNLIYSTFSINNNYSNQFIKNTLREIYSNLGYKKSPKATDLNEYFETKFINYIEDGKKMNGLKLLNRKIS